MTSSITDMLATWAVTVMESLGGPGAALVVALDNVFPPIPSELVLPLAGFAASRGTFSFAAALAWTTAGSVAGATVVYLAGLLLGHDRTRRLVARIPLVDPGDVDRAGRWFARHGAVAVLVGRMVPLVRSAISLPAGVERLPLPTFLGLTTLGSGAWNTLLVTAGSQLGANWTLVDRYAGVLQYVVVGALVVAVVLFVALRLRRRPDVDEPVTEPLARYRDPRS
ncbi:MAG: DedA family protein [Pseudonocardia sediminis]